MIKGNKLPRTAIMATAALIIILTSCQGRTNDNMIPKGETVEVVIAAPEEVEIDTIHNSLNQTDSLQNEI